MSDQTKEVIHVEVSRDKMLGVVWFTMKTEEGNKLTSEEIQLIIEEKGITHGLQEDVIKEIIETRRYDYKYIVARGKPAVDGEDGKLSFYFDIAGINELKPRLNEDGTVDFKDLGAIYNVEKGDALAKRTLATAGEDGYNVLGQELKARRGKEVRLPKGKNTEIAEDEQTLVAAVNGKLEYDNYNVYINTVYTLNGDVDSSTGNIDFIGNVVIGGSVHGGFTVKAQGSVEVKGPVEDAVIIAGGDIILGYGIQGSEKSKLVAGGNIYAKFIQNAHAEAKEDIITEAIIHSKVTAGNRIMADVGKGTIVGGNVAATNKIEAISIGSPMGTVTAVQIGLLPNVYMEYKALGETLKAKQENLTKVEQSIGFLEAKLKEGQLDLNKKLMLGKLRSTKEPLVQELQSLKLQYRELSTKLRDVKEGMIKVNGDLYPGVKVMFGNMIKYIDEGRVNCMIRKKDGDIYIG